MPLKPFDKIFHEPPRIDINGFNLLPKKKPEQPLAQISKRVTSTNNLQSRRNTAVVCETTK